VNRGVLCAKGSAGIMQHYSPARLRKPMLRTGERGKGEFREIEWDEALALATDWLAEARAQDPGRPAFFTGRGPSQARTGRWAPSLRHGGRARGLAGDFLAEPGEAGEIVAEAAFGVFVGVIENANRAAPAAVADRGKERGVEFALREGDDFLAAFVAVGDGAVEVEREEVGLHQREQRGETRDVVVAVVEVVDEADVGEAGGAEVLDKRQLVFRLACATRETGSRNVSDPTKPAARW